MPERSPVTGSYTVHVPKNLDGTFAADPKPAGRIVTPKSARDELLATLRRCGDQGFDGRYFHSDIEVDHINADDALIKYINDPEISEAYEGIRKWYA